MVNKLLVKYNKVSIERDKEIILHDVNIEINKGDFLYIIGKVGSGKSTFLKSIYADIPIFSGEAFVFDYQIDKIRRKNIPYLRRKIGIVFQDFQLLLDRTVYKNLEFVLKATGWKKQLEIKERILAVLKQTCMTHKIDSMPYELSGGEQQRVVIARALLNSPELILADEPTGNLDPETGSQIIDLLQTISEKGTAVVMSTHNYSIVKAFPGRIIKCENKKLINLSSEYKD